jgi:uncharacterized protein (TIGR02646 family)
LKKINKTQGENELTQFLNGHTNKNWEDFRNHHSGNDYKNIRQLMLNDQGGLCAYCESKLDHLPEHKQRIEHYHSKSDCTGATNWALDWQNIFAVCIGGSDTDKNIHPLPDNLSCDAHKDHLIQDNKLAKACEGCYLNPLELIATPCLFAFDKATGKIMPDLNACNNWQAPENHYTSTYDLVEKTIEILNLNCQRLLDDRLEVLKSYNQEIKKARMTGDKQGLTKLAQRWFQNKWPSFFTTRRLLLGNHAENYLTQIAYNG